MLLRVFRLVLLLVLLLVGEIAAFIAVPVSRAIGRVFHTVSEIAYTFM